MNNEKLIIKWLFAEDLDNENIAACGRYLNDSIDIIKTNKYNIIYIFS